MEALVFGSLIEYRPLWQKRLLAAIGYAELDMTQASLEELRLLDKAEQGRPEVISLYLHHRMIKKQWAAAFDLSMKLCRSQPQCPNGFIHAAFCQNKLGYPEKAKRILLKAPPSAEKEAIFHYNLGCYEVILGNKDKGLERIHRSFELDPSFREIAQKDSDLKTLAHLLK